MWSDGLIMMEILADKRTNKKSKGTATGIVKVLNKESGKTSAKILAFDEVKWGLIS